LLDGTGREKGYSGLIRGSMEVVVCAALRLGKVMGKGSTG